MSTGARITVLGDRVPGALQRPRPQAVDGPGHRRHRVPDARREQPGAGGRDPGTPWRDPRPQRPADRRHPLGAGRRPRRRARPRRGRPGRAGLHPASVDAVGDPRRRGARGGRLGSQPRRSDHPGRGADLRAGPAPRRVRRGLPGRLGVAPTGPHLPGGRARRSPARLHRRSQRGRHRQAGDQPDRPGGAGRGGAPVRRPAPGHPGSDQVPHRRRAERARRHRRAAACTRRQPGAHHRPRRPEDPGERRSPTGCRPLGTSYDPELQPDRRPSLPGAGGRGRARRHRRLRGGDVLRPRLRPEPVRRRGQPARVGPSVGALACSTTSPSRASTPRRRPSSPSPTCSPSRRASSPSRATPRQTTPATSATASSSSGSPTAARRCSTTGSPAATATSTSTQGCRASCDLYFWQIALNIWTNRQGHRRRHHRRGPAPEVGAAVRVRRAHRHRPPLRAGRVDPRSGVVRAGPAREPRVWSGTGRGPAATCSTRSSARARCWSPRCSSPTPTPPWSTAARCGGPGWSIGSSTRTGAWSGRTARRRSTSSTWRPSRWPSSADDLQQVDQRPGRHRPRCLRRLRAGARGGRRQDRHRRGHQGRDRRGGRRHRGVHRGGADQRSPLCGGRGDRAGRERRADRRPHRPCPCSSTCSTARSGRQEIEVEEEYTD